MAAGPTSTPAANAQTPSSSGSAARLGFGGTLAAYASLSSNLALTEAAENMSSVGPGLTTTLEVAPPLCAQFLFMSGLKVCKEIKEAGTTGSFQPLPFVSMYTNCSVWTIYGLMIDNMTVLAPNVSGLVMGVGYTYWYQKHHPTVLTKEYAISGGIIATAAAAALTFPAAVAAPYVGYIGCGLAVVLMASPLAALGTVIKTKSTASMPFITSVATFANASTWTGFGYLVVHDPIIWVPNALGLAAATFQFGLFAKFGIHSPDDKAKTNKDASA
jgi:solute carrier family 50 protein (sugar transporter)